MILEIDMGNTRIKWRLRDESGTVTRGVAEGLEDIRGKLPDQLWPESVKVASVRDQRQNKKLSDWCRCTFQLEAEFARSERACAGVANGYAKPDTLGVDRWLGMLEAFNRWGGPCLVAQAGTALTVDLLNESGRHLGGYIGTGLYGLRRSLIKDASRVYVRETCPSDLSLAPGIDTDSAVWNGSVAMMLGLIERGWSELVGLGDTRPKLVLSGGDGPLLANWLPEAILVPELVLDGLRWTGKSEPNETRLG